MTQLTEYILISACLLGERVRFDGRVRKHLKDKIVQWRSQERLIAFCPEVAGGLSVPRPRAEIVAGVGCDVLCGKARVADARGRNVTAAFLQGAQIAMEFALKGRTSVAVMKDGSPSCGVSYIYDGSFSGKRIPGSGVTTALLKANGIKVYSEKDIICFRASKMSGSGVTNFKRVLY
jgi:uncharacterized protein YbbK (DUF523 family)